MVPLLLCFPKDISFVEELSLSIRAQTIAQILWAFEQVKFFELDSCGFVQIWNDSLQLDKHKCCRAQVFESANSFFFCQSHFDPTFYFILGISHCILLFLINLIGQKRKLKRSWDLYHLVCWSQLRCMVWRRYSAVFAGCLCSNSSNVKKEGFLFDCKSFPTNHKWHYTPVSLPGGDWDWIRLTWQA